MPLYISCCPDCPVRLVSPHLSQQQPHGSIRQRLVCHKPCTRYMPQTPVPPGQHLARVWLQAQRGSQDDHHLAVGHDERQPGRADAEGHPDCDDKAPVAVGTSSETPASDPTGTESVGVALALGALNWYRSFLSPIMPNTCRFLPSCSQYSMQAYKEHGVARGTVLTAWRLLRCSPLNWNLKYQGKYDPPTWPPVGFEWLGHKEQ